MEWLSQYWIWIIVAVGAVWLLSRRRAGLMGACGHDMAHEGPREASKAESGDTPQSAVKKAGDREAAGAASSHRRRGGCCR
jgi:hypothetical protein